MEQVEAFVDLFKLLGDRNRLTIILCLKERELCVCELVEILDASQPNISQHLRKLKDAGLLSERREGQWIYYSLNIDEKPEVQTILNLLPSQKKKLIALTPVNCN